MKTIRLTLKIGLISLLIGISVGAVNTLFGRTLLAIGEIRSHYFHYLIPFLALAGATIIWAYHYFGKELQKGMGLVLQVGKGQAEDIPKRLIPLVMVSTWITHLFGGSAGREGVAIQIGATISHNFGKKWLTLEDKTLFLTTGIAAGFAGLFQTPLAASFFALKVLHKRTPSWQQVLSIFIAAFSASTTSHLLGLEKFTHHIGPQILTGKEWLGLLVAGLTYGLIGNSFALLLKKSKVGIANPYQRIIFGSLILSIIFFIAHQGRYSGLGTNLIEASLTGQVIYNYDWLLKIVLTVATLSIGFQGGEVTPLFAIGASSGIVLANLLGLPLELTAALGYASVFAAATNTWLAPILIGCEVFGFTNLPAFLLVTSLATLIYRKISIYQ
ncbi:chloride channel protein [Streptococcus sp. 20-1249]|uniref:chloride channel protein n=1 Tax=Streptococcus hepaticus TaxID=3349163 RepID=UPI00374890E5